MQEIGKISREAAARNLPFLLIGGHAVMAHGFVRATDDIDFLVRKSHSTNWQKLLKDLKYTLYHSAPTFLQFDPPASEKFPLDLMLVPDESFDRMFAQAKMVQSDGTETKVVSLAHLLALKCHAFRNRPHRAIKDIEDLVQLVEVNKLDLNEPALRAILIKHGGKELYELLEREKH